MIIEEFISNVIRDKYFKELALALCRKTSVTFMKDEKIKQPTPELVVIKSYFLFYRRTAGSVMIIAE